MKRLFLVLSLMPFLLRGAEPNITTNTHALPVVSAQKQKLINRLPAGSVTVLDQPYVANARPSPVPHSSRLLDLYVPPGTGPFPLVVWIHGGGWHGGDKEGGVDVAARFLPAGFAVASLDYRLTQDHAPFPAQINDCFAALIWLRQNAARYHLDPDQVGVMGHSAGAHLAALMATTGGTTQFVATAAVSTRIQAAVCWSGPFDLGRERGHWPHTMFAWHPNDPFCQTFFPGGAYDETFARWASPASYVHSNLPPMLIVQGAKDTIIPPAQAEAFARSVKQAGNDVSFRLDPDHGHDTIQSKSYAEALDFLARTLKR